MFHDLLLLPLALKQQKIDWCIAELEKKLPSNTLKEVLNILSKIDLTGARNLEVLAKHLLNILENYKNQDLEEADPTYIYYFAQKTSWLYPRTLNILTRLVVQVDSEMYERILQVFRTIINNPDKFDSTTYDVASENLIRAAHSLDTMHSREVYEFFKHKLFKGHRVWQSLLIMGKFILNEDERLELFIICIKILEQKGFNRGEQKDIRYIIVELFNTRLPKEQTKIFQKCIEPLINNKSLYVRQVLVEIINEIHGFEEERKKLLVELLKDPESEVRRFANQSPLLSEPFAKKQKTNEPVEVIYMRKTLEFNQNDTKPNPNFNTPEGKEFIAFKKQTPINFKDNLIKGLKNQNRLIVEYCWESLIKIYVIKGSISDKRKWLHILKNLIEAGSPHITLWEITDHIFWEFKDAIEIRCDIILMILSLVKKPNFPFNLDLANLLYTFSFKDLSELANNIIQAVLEVLGNPHAQDETKEFMLSLLSFLPHTQKADATRIFISACNRKFGDKLSWSGAGEIIRQLNEMREISAINEEFLLALSTIDLNNAKEIETIETIFRFMIFVISHDGGGNLGNCAANQVSKLLSNTTDPFFFTFVYQVIESYGLADLEIIQNLRNTIRSTLIKTTNNGLNMAWSMYFQERYDISLREATTLIKRYKNSENPILGKIYYLAAINLIKFGKLEAASKNLELSEEMSYSSGAILFLKGEIKQLEKNYGEAMQYYQEAAMLAPFYVEPHYKIHELFAIMGNYDAAEKAFQDVIRLNPRACSPYLKHQLLLQNFSFSYFPFYRQITRLEQKLDEFVYFCTTNLNQANKGDNEEIFKNIKEKFEEFLHSLERIFDPKIVRNCKEATNPPWEDQLFKYPNQIPRYMNDLFFSILKQEIPLPFHPIYRAFLNRTSDMQDLSKQIKEANISQYITTDLSQHGKVFTAFDFIRRYAFKPDLQNGYALGLSSEISESYNILTGILGLKHWTIAYQELEVEPSGETKDTHKFLDKVVKTNKPIVLFVPVLPRETPKHHVTLDELEYLVKKGIPENIFFVFGAYDFLPMYILEEDTFQKGRKSSQKSFKSVMMYLTEVLEYDINYFKQFFKATFEHMLLTRIKINLIHDVPEAPSIIYKEFLSKINFLFEKKLSFDSLLDELISRLKFNQGHNFNNQHQSNREIFCLVGSLLFHDLPWFGSHLQPTKTNLPILQKLQLQLEQEQKNIEKNSLNLMLYMETINDFLNRLPLLIQEVQHGIRWLGISNYSYIPSQKLCNFIKNFDKTEVQQNNYNRNMQILVNNSHKRVREEDITNLQNGINNLKISRPLLWTNRKISTNKLNDNKMEERLLNKREPSKQEREESNNFNTTSEIPKEQVDIEIAKQVSLETYKEENGSYENNDKLKQELKNFQEERKNALKKPSKKR